jgi:phosphatidylglycerophosphatase A
LAISRLAVAIATVGYLGFVPFVPGTWGSAAGVLFFVAMRSRGTPGYELGLIAAVAVVGTWAADRAERELARKDPGPIVIDEVLGMLLTLALLPASVPVVSAGFVIFRLYDVLKPFPVGRLERAPGGFGIMLDDALAGVYANVTLRFLMALAPGWFM